MPLRVLLVRPPIYTKTLAYPSGPRFGAPVGLLYIAAYLEHLGIDISIYDALVDFDWDEVSMDSSGHYHIGAPWSRLKDRVLKHQPTVVGITNPFSDVVDYTLRTAREIKAARPEVVTVVGGPHATSCPEAFLGESGTVDYVVRGEGEKTFNSMLQALAKGDSARNLPGISYREDGRVQTNPQAPFITDLDGLPLPAYHLVPMERYFELARTYPSRFTFEYPGSEREISIVTSRGCPFHCVFCGNHLHMGRRWRYNSVPYVLDHMDLLVNRYGVRHFHLEDDNIGLDVERFGRILDGIQTKGWNITWDTSNGIRLEGLDAEIVRKAKRSGCTYLEFGIDSGKQETLDRIVKKGIKLEDAERVIMLCEQSFIDVHVLFVIGFPGETPDDIQESLRFAKHLLWRYGAIPHVCMARPLPGTELYEICEQNEYLTEPILPDMGSSLRGEVFPRTMIRTELFGPEDLERWLARFNREVIAIVSVKMLVWLARHPRVIPAVFKKFWSHRQMGVRGALKRLFYGGLFFKFNYLNRDLGGR